MNIADLPMCLSGHRKYQEVRRKDFDGGGYNQHFMCEVCGRSYFYIDPGIGNILITARATQGNLKVPRDVVNGYLIQVLDPFWKYHRKLWDAADKERVRLTWLTVSRELGYPDYTEAKNIPLLEARKSFEDALKAAADVYPPPPLPTLYPPQFPDTLIGWFRHPHSHPEDSPVWESIRWEKSARIPVPILRGDVS